MKITVAGMGYVGLSLAVLLSQQNTVYAIDIDSNKVDALRRSVSPIQDDYIEAYLSDKELNLVATSNPEEAYTGADFVIVAVPTNYDVEKDAFDTSAVEAVIKTVRQYSGDSIIVIKSTVPIGYTEKLRQTLGEKSILFSPEFLREGKALYDNLYPSRIIVGTELSDRELVEKANQFAELLQSGSKKESVAKLIMGYSEAEAVKLFANTYLAMRISYINELDTYAEVNGLNTEQIIQGVCMDPRIGMFYNNPSFGYGGYCLPKDTKQMLSNFTGIPESLICAIVTSNQIRKQYIAERVCAILEHLPGKERKTVGIYRLSVKSNSDNFRSSAIFGVIEQLQAKGVDLILFEPLMADGEFVKGCARIYDLDDFKKQADLIIANRFDASLEDVREKVYTRDLFGRD